MNILMLTPFYPNRSSEYSGIFVKKLSQALLHQGHQVTVIAPIPRVPWPLSHISQRYAGYRHQPAHDFDDGIHVYFPRYTIIPRRKLPRVAEFSINRVSTLASTLHSNTPFDVIHLNNTYPMGALANHLANKWNVPYITQLHGDSFRQTLNRNPWLRRSTENTLRNSTQIVCVGSPLVEVVHQAMGDSLQTPHVVHNGIDPQTIVDVPSCDLRERFKDKTMLLTIANLVPSKGVDLVLLAMAELIHDYPNLHYVIVGGGKQRHKLEKLANTKGIKQHVSFEGPVPHQRAMEYMAQADIFAMLSKNEGLGIVYLEAMVNGLPVIGSLGEGIADIIVDGQNGLLIPPHDVTALIGAVRTLIEEPTLAQQLGEKAKSDIETQYTWEIIAHKWINIYNLAYEYNKKRNN